MGGVPSEVVKLLTQATICKYRITAVIPFQNEIPMIIFVVLSSCGRAYHNEPMTKNIEDNQHNKYKSIFRVKHGQNAT
jgi:hypothetical protein